jgi:hypothetical protein
MFRELFIILGECPCVAAGVTYNINYLYKYIIGMLRRRGNKWQNIGLWKDNTKFWSKLEKTVILQNCNILQVR